MRKSSISQLLNHREDIEKEIQELDTQIYEYFKNNPKKESQSANITKKMKKSKYLWTRIQKILTDKEKDDIAMQWSIAEGIQLTSLLKMITFENILEEE